MQEVMTPFEEAQLQVLGGILCGHIEPSDTKVTSEHITVDSFIKKVFRAAEVLEENNEPISKESVLTRAGINYANKEALDRLRVIQGMAHGRFDYTQQERFILEQNAIKQVEKEIRRLAAQGVHIQQDVDELAATIQHVQEYSGSTEQHDKDAFEELDSIIENGLEIGLSTPFRDLTGWLGGWVPSRLYYVGGRPGMGKTQFAINCALKNIEQNEHAIIFSKEMRKTALIGRMVCNMSMVNQSVLLRPKGMPLPEGAAKKLKDNQTMLVARQDCFTIFEEKMSVPRMRQKIQLVKRKYPHKKIVVYIDYIALIPDARRGKDIRERITNVAQDLQDAAKSLNIPIVCLAQLNRASAQTNDKVPTLTDLKESGAIEETADAVILLHRPGYYLQNKPDEAEKMKNIMELFVAKNRHGKAGKIVAHFVEETGYMTDTTRGPF